MNAVITFAEGFMNLFDVGAETFVSWVTTIIPKVCLLLVFMNSLIAFIGPEKVDKFANKCSKNVVLAYGVLPFISAFMLGNPMVFSMGKFLPEFQKPSYYAAAGFAGEAMASGRKGESGFRRLRCAKLRNQAAANKLPWAMRSLIRSPIAGATWLARSTSSRFFSPSTATSALRIGPLRRRC